MTSFDKQSPDAAKYLLEMARSLSLEHHSEPVLCTHFLPWMDLAVSADDEVLLPTWSNARVLQSRYREVLTLVESTQHMVRHRAEWCRSLVSFGLVRWWPVSIRAHALQSLGPFRLTIDCLEKDQAQLQIAEVS